MTSVPRFLFVDDDVDSLPEFQLIGNEQRRTVADIKDITSEDVNWADVILCDFDLDNVPSIRAALSATIPRNGLGVAAAIRSVLQGSDLRKVTPLKAFVVLTNDASRLTILPQGYRSYAAAAGADIDWIFDKPSREQTPEFERKLLALGTAVKNIPPTMPNDVEAVFGAVKKLLAIDKMEPHLSDRVWQDVLDAHPRLRDSADVTNNEALYRWLLREALPFPSFVIGPEYLAARLRVNPQSVADALSASDGKLATELSQARYRGVLADFFDDRWWSGAVEQILWEITDHRPFDIDALRSLTNGKSRTDESELVVALDANLRPYPLLRTLADVRPVDPVGWPLFAQRAWMSEQDEVDAANFLEITAPGPSFA